MLKILFLGPEDSPLLGWLEAKGELVLNTSTKISAQFIEANSVEFIISYGYRHILKRDVLNKVAGRAINLHISFLPWNRGADPNFWSFVDGTPKGVSIHFIDEGLDTGDIIVQKKIHLDSETETLASSYLKLHRAIQELFKENWKNIKLGRCNRSKQNGKGSFHRRTDRDLFSHLMTKGWDTPVADLEKCSKIK